MSKSIKNTNIEFGILNIPVKVKVARKDSSPSFKQYCPEGHKITYKKVCKGDCEGEIPYEDIKEGYKIGEDKVMFDKEETKADIDNIEIEGFTDKINPIHFKDMYYLSPDNSDTQYNLFKELLQRQNVVPIGRIAIRSSEELVTIIPYKDVLLLVKLYQEAEVRETPEVEETEIDETQLEQLKGLIEEEKLGNMVNKKQQELEERIDQALEDKIQNQDEKQKKKVVNNVN